MRSIRYERKYLIMGLLKIQNYRADRNVIRGSIKVRKLKGKIKQYYKNVYQI